MTKNNQKGFSILDVVLVIALVGVIGVAGYFAYRNATTAKSDKTAAAKASSTPSASPTPVDPYKGWKTFRLAKEGLSIKHPSSWKLTEIPASSYSFGGFKLTSENNYVIRATTDAISPDGGYGPERVVSFTDELTNTNYGKPLYVVGSYDKSSNCCDLISVNTDKSLFGRYRSKITDPVSGYTRNQYELHSLANYVQISGSYPGPADGATDPSKPHAAAESSKDITEARKILGSLLYE